MEENNPRNTEAEDDKMGFWDYAWRVVTVVSILAFGIFFFGGMILDVNIDQDGHFSYEIGNHPGRMEFTRHYTDKYFYPPDNRGEGHSAKMSNAECRNPVWFEPANVAGFEEVEKKAASLSHGWDCGSNWSVNSHSIECVKWFGEQYDTRKAWGDVEK